MIIETAKNEISDKVGLKTYYLATYGCQMNVYDSNMVAQMLEGRGLGQTENIAEADIIVVNTCSIRGGAEEKALARIAGMRHHKKNNPHVKIAVIGCMAQNLPQEIAGQLEHVDYVIGPDNYKVFEKDLFNDHDFSPDKIQTEVNDFENYAGQFAKLDSPVSVNITIMRGCNKKCSYCIVPFVRGKERSRDPGEIENEVRRAAAEGIPEVVLLGQTVNSYLKKTDTGLETFATLLRRLNKIKGIRRIRFTSPHPRHFTSDVIAAMAESENVSPHVHLPLQSGSNHILKSMRRQYTREEYLDIVKNLRAAIPEIGITTDIITGYVGESEDDFQQTLSLVEEVHFDSAFMFSYSPRKGTEAYAWEESLSEEEKSRRLQTLIDLQNQITAEKLAESVGKTFEVLLEGPSHKNPGEWIGKSNCFKKVILPYRENFQPGRILRAKIEERRGFTLAGTLIGDEA